MSKIMLFGSNNISVIPYIMKYMIEEYSKQGHEFIVGDKRGLEALLHRELSAAGALNNSTIYCMDSPTSNVYDIKTRVYKTTYDVDNKKAIITTDSLPDFIHEICSIEKEIDVRLDRNWYTFRDRKMIEDCDVAIGLYSQADDSKTVDKIIQLLNISNKACYMYPA